MPSHRQAFDTTDTARLDKENRLHFDTAIPTKHTLFTLINFRVEAKRDPVETASLRFIFT
jgi:hypothetical protein